MANGATAELDGCVIEAQRAAAGAAGMGYTSAAMAGMIGESGNDACTGSFTAPGNPVSSGCGTPDSMSGDGGNGLVSSGGAGSPGSPGSAMNGGLGEMSGVCTPGMVGDPGMPGTLSQGATSLGSVAGGNYTGTAGTDGASGTPGQGGGGGGGGRGGHAIGIAYTGTAVPSMTGVSFGKQGTPGPGGVGDDSMGNKGSGTSGVAANVQGF